MVSVTNTPTPIHGNESGTGWHLKPRRRILFMFEFFFVAACLFSGTAKMVDQGDPILAVILACFGLTLVSVPFWKYRRGRPPYLLDSGSGTGLALPVHTTNLGIVIVPGVPGVVLTSIAAILAIRGHDLTAAPPFYIFLMILMAGIILLFIAYHGLRHRQYKGRALVLTPESIELRHQFRPQVLPWESVTEVQAHWERIVGARLTPQDPIYNYLSFELAPGTEVKSAGYSNHFSTKDETSVETGMLAVNPYTVLELLRFYLDHPDFRSELGTEASLARVTEITRRLERPSAS
jgi:hypothetical protein